MTESLRDRLQLSLGSAYVIERELGGGGMSRVFVAEETRFKRRVVIKVLSPELSAGLSVERFEREIALAAALQEPHIVPVITAGDVDGLPWYSMPFVEGETLRLRLERAPIPVSEATSVLRDVARALAYAHGRGIVHRDIKPENVLISSGTAVVTDFGIAKAVSASKAQAPGGTLTQVGTSIGTPAYMAPEQAVGDVVDHRADLYSWGVLAYEILAGAHPFAGKTSAQQLVAAHIAEVPRPVGEIVPAVPASVRNVVMQALEKDPARRPATATALLEGLDRVPDIGESVARGSVAPSAPRPPRGVWNGVRLAVAIVVAVAAAATFYRWRSSDADSDSRAPGAVSSIAVLPFTNTGGDQKDEYFSDGMTDELALALARLPGLRVAGRSSSYAYKGRHLPAPELGRALGVSALLEGTVRRSGSRLRITAQLTRAADGAVQWSNSYERGAGEVFALQDELTREIVAALAPTLGAPLPAGGLAPRGTDDLEAYDLYLRGHHFWAMRGGDNLLRAVTYFERAVARDPTFARAHAGLAKTYAVMPFFMPDPADTLTLRGIASGERALALDSTLADAHLGIAAAISIRGRPMDADRHQRAAIALEPMSATAHQWHGDNLLLLGRVEESVAELRKSVELDPLSSIAHNDLAMALISARRFDEAIVAARRAVELGGEFSAGAAALAHLFAGNADSAVRLGTRYASTIGDASRSSAFLALAHAALGKWSTVDRIRDEVARARAADASGVDAATVALAYGDRAPLIRVLLSTEGRRQWVYRWNTLCTPLLDPLMTDSAYLDMLDRQGMARCAPSTPWPIKPPPRQ